MAVGNLFKYKTTYELTLSDSGIRMTGPMYNNTIKIHKGIDDKITFNVYDENRRLASISHLSLAVNLIDANTAFHQIMQAMATGKIDPMQIQQTANIDEGALWFDDEQELAIQQPSRQDRLARLAEEFGYLNDKAAAQGVNPIIR